MVRNRSLRRHCDNSRKQIEISRDAQQLEALHNHENVSTLQ